MKEKKEKKPAKNTNKEKFGTKFVNTIKKKWLISGTNTLLLIAILVAIVILINSAVQSLDLTPIDCTSNKEYTLTNESKDRVKNIQYISSLNIRISHEVIGCADALMPYITVNRQICHTLIISPPCCGKTTLIRDLIRQISDGNQYLRGCSVGVVDERSELGGCYLGIAQNHLGTRTDVLDCCPKAEGMIMLIRSMAPQVIAVDEIGTIEDIHAIEYAMQCGCRMIASVHGLNMDEASKKPVLGTLIRRRMFQRYVVLGNENGPGEILGIYDERGSVLCRG